MKKLTASILAGALMISAVGINAFAAESGKPTIKVYGSSVAAENGETVNLNVRLSDFAGVFGMDFKIEGTGVAFGEPTSNELDLKKNSNYVNDGATIHIVELNAKNDTINIKIPATVNGYEAGKVTVTSSKLAPNGNKLFTEKSDYTVNNDNGNIAVVPENKTTSKDLQDNSETFYPYGSVYTGSACTDETRLKKDGNGQFAITESTTYKAFAKPKNNILTFGTSKKTNAASNENNLQFGTYTDKTSAANGTMLILGSWENYINYQIRKNGLTTEEALKEMYNAELADGKEYAKLYYYNADNDRKAILVYKKSRTTYMWKMDDNSAMEYALRVYDSGKYTCTAVGYYADGENVIFSSQLKSNNLTK